MRKADALASSVEQSPLLYALKVWLVPGVKPETFATVEPAPTEVQLPAGLGAVFLYHHASEWLAMDSFAIVASMSLAVSVVAPSVVKVCSAILEEVAHCAPAKAWYVYSVFAVSPVDVL